ncbi:MAG TPA: endolytic transglycosylase MltG, partial [Acidimicrobiales bacterium]|nr:endolytic transglycosylase MltG [Acidimicrobiales bacterium]
MSGPHDWSDAPGERTGARGRRGDADFYDQRSHTGYQEPDEEHYEDGSYDDGHYHDDEHYEDEHYDDGAWPVVGAQAGGAGGSRPRSSRRRERRRGAHPILKALGIAVVLVLLIAGGGVIWARTQIDPGGHRGALVTVVIPKGSTTSAIGDRLASQGVIHQGWLFALYVRLHGDGPLYPGTYRLQKNLPYSAAISALTAGPKIVTENLVVPEGYTVA